MVMRDSKGKKKTDKDSRLSSNEVDLDECDSRGLLRVLKMVKAQRQGKKVDPKFLLQR